MATYTTHYKLKKPEPTDTSEIITDLNTNYDSIDTYLYHTATLLNDVVAKKHEHTNKALLDTFRITEGVLEYSLDGTTYTPVEGTGSSGSGDMLKSIYLYYSLKGGL